MIIQDKDGQNVAYVSEEYLEQVLKAKKSANTPRKKVKEETTYGTPLWLVKAIEEDFQLNFTFDLAADTYSCVINRLEKSLEQVKHLEHFYKGGGVTPGRLYFGLEDNSLEQDWNNLTGDLWLNPPFANIKAWAAKCETYQNGTICMLVPASLGSKWFRDYCMGRPVAILDSRITFDGHTDPYPKDLMVVLFSNNGSEDLRNFAQFGSFTRFHISSYSVKSCQSQANVDKTKDSLRKLSELSEEYNLPD